MAINLDEPYEVASSQEWTYLVKELDRFNGMNYMGAKPLILVPTPRGTGMCAAFLIPENRSYRVRTLKPEESKVLFQDLINELKPDVVVVPIEIADTFFERMGAVRSAKQKLNYGGVVAYTMPDGRTVECHNLLLEDHVLPQNHLKSKEVSGNRNNSRK
jgi:hypothetical protein